MEDEHYFVAGFLSAVLLPFILLLLPDVSIGFRVGWFCFSRGYVVLPLVFLAAYLLWRRGRKLLSMMVAALATGLTLYGLLLYILWLAFISEY